MKSVYPVHHQQNE